MEFFDINNIAFDWLGYQISWLELAGTAFNFACVVLAAKRKIANWPIGLVGVVLFMALFYQINLYADFGEQIFYLVTGVIGWIAWSRAGADGPGKNEVAITRNSLRVNLWWLCAIVAGTVLTSIFLFNIDKWLPTLFPEPASLPVLDAVTTMASFAAQILMMRRKLECWYLWIAVDVMAIGIYWYKGVPFVALLYAAFLVNAIYGYLNWRKEFRGQPQPLAVRGNDD